MSVFCQRACGQPHRRALHTGRAGHERRKTAKARAAAKPHARVSKAKPRLTSFWQQTATTVCSNGCRPFGGKCPTPNLCQQKTRAHARSSSAPAKSPAAEIKDFPQTEVNRGWGKFSGERPLLGPKALPLPPLLRACARVFC